MIRVIIVVACHRSQL